MSIRFIRITVIVTATITFQFNLTIRPCFRAQALDRSIATTVTSLQCFPTLQCFPDATVPPLQYLLLGFDQKKSTAAEFDQKSQQPAEFDQKSQQPAEFDQKKNNTQVQAAGQKLCSNTIPVMTRSLSICSWIMAEEGKTKIEKFDGQNFGWWRMQITDLLIQKDLDLVLEPPPTPMTPVWLALDKKAKSTIRLALSMNVAYNILEETTARGIMNALANMHEKPSAANKVFLIRELVNTRMKEGSSVTDHINVFNSHLRRLSSVNFKIDDELQACLLLSSLPDSWSGTITAVTGSVDVLTFNKVRDLILNEDSRRRSTGESSNSLLSTESRGRKSERGKNRGRSKSRKRGQSKPRADIECWNCKEKGHFRNQCPKPPTVKKEVNNVTVEKQDDEESEDETLICCVESSVESWIMDSGASFHAVSCPDMVRNLRTCNHGRVRLADDQILDITGIGDVDLKTSLGTNWTLENVRVIPNLRRKLISVGQLDDLGYDVTFGGGQWKVVKGNMVIAKGKKRGTLYMVEVPASGINAVTSGSSPSSLWHQRLGHMSEKGMKMLVAKGKLPEIKRVESEFCEPCVLGKKKVSFVKTGKALKAQKLELIHSDVFGPTPVPSLGGSRYYVTFIDDATRKSSLISVLNMAFG
ncbi:hypothetical protein L1987_43520 [Smallanthus sonchifolius]|uniref:Uncharacterized protein n=1 Tax=Smallanthus sonchifolius TaxID=185202 RepID=A0ACB9GN32_9ASTR|nr:hypothetical protein L1987_43520 [Smallanthus sonchifolius]